MLWHRQPAIHPSDQTVKFRRESKNKIDTLSTQMVRKKKFKVLEQKGIHNAQEFCKCTTSVHLQKCSYTRRLDRKIMDYYYCNKGKYWKTLIQVLEN
jgi:hypothetical protein